MPALAQQLQHLELQHLNTLKIIIQFVAYGPKWKAGTSTLRIYLA
jgi:hypothetical protein